VGEPAAVDAAHATPAERPPSVRERLRLVGPADGSRLAGLDGLRGIAVAFVVLDHAHVDGWLWHIFSIGGTAGVTTFFVLSGFLITSLLLREHDVRSRIDLPAFWGRRALRLLPGLWLWLAVTTLVFWLAGWSQLGYFVDNLVKPAVLYYADFEVLRRPLGPVQHTWSLAVEEQFYLVWPLLLIGLLLLVRRWRARLGPTALVVVLLALTVVAGWWRLRVGEQPGGLLAATRRPDTNAVSLLAGATLAAVTRGGWRPPSWCAWLGWPVVVAMLVVPRLPGLTHRFTTVNAVILLTVLAVLALATSSTVFTSRALRSVGAISYGLYLWHFPLMTAYAGEVFRPLGNHRAATSVLIALGAAVAAYLSFVLVERPLMRRYKRRLERVHLTARPAAPEAQALRPRAPTAPTAALPRPAAPLP
jgi:peptidoglycan/LPS O-acetylase OafA/YrhL